MSEQESKLYALYQAVHLMMARLGADGEIDTRAPEVDAVMDAMHEYDGGQYIQWNTPQPVTPAGGEVYLMEPENVADKSLPLIQLFGGVCIDGKTLYHRTIGAPWPYHPPVADAALHDAVMSAVVKLSSMGGVAPAECYAAHDILRQALIDYADRGAK